MNNAKNKNRVIEHIPILLWFSKYIILNSEN